MISGPKILGDHDGDRISSAVTEGIREAFNSGRGRVGGDPRRSQSVDAALDQDLSDIQAGSLESGDQAEAQRAGHEIPVNADVVSAAEQSRIGVPQIEETADRGKEL